MAKLRELIRGNKGQGLVEFALVLPVLLLLVFGIIQFGFIFNAYMVTGYASREGARVAALGKSDSDIEAATMAAAVTIGINENDVIIVPSAPRNKGTSVTVTVKHDVDVFLPLMPKILGNSVSTDGSTVMRMESTFSGS